MIFLDMCGTFIALCYLLVLKFESIILLYVLTFTQQSIAALYEPVRNAIVPMLVTDDEFLSKANMLTGLSWSVMAAVGSALGGFATANLGPQGCFCKLHHFCLSSFFYLCSFIFSTFHSHS